MNNDYVIFADASADVHYDDSIAEGLKFVEMPCESDGNIYVCTGTDSAEKIRQFYTDIRSGSLPKTTQITPFKYEEMFEPFLKEGKSVLYLSLSSGLSSTFESAKLAAENLNAKHDNAKFYPIDSIGATAAMCIILERMQSNQKNGLTAEENKADIEEFKHTLYTTCYVEDLKHLHRGGRISAAKAAIGSLLKIKPIIRIMEDGTIANCDNCRGTRSAVIHLAKKYEEMGNMSEVVYVSDADNAEMADFLEEEIKRINPNAVIRRTLLSPIIGTHLGPESVLISFVRK